MNKVVHLTLGIGGDYFKEVDQNTRRIYICQHFVATTLGCAYADCPKKIQVVLSSQPQPRFIEVNIHDDGVELRWGYTDEPEHEQCNCMYHKLEEDLRSLLNLPVATMSDPPFNKQRKLWLRINPLLPEVK